ncbi:hypothetical protein ABN16_11925 [Levilactobacillus koreensis]|uniref:Uncharacterized protein n=1 Tax=Levilactobacillus koreensis TaxID=637971 RepID=A0AAC8UX43_9LACO|nr:hypothetical protein ABN16_11925 [Levilactobacillus koreensis]
MRILLAGRWLANNMGDFGDAWSSWLQIEREDWCSSSLKRPHSRRNLWQPQCGQFILIFMLIKITCKQVS